MGDYRMVQFGMLYVVCRTMTLPMTLSDLEPYVRNYKTDFV